MMSVEEYALDVDRKVEEIIRRAQELGIDVTSADDMLDDEAITILDNNLDDISEEEALEDRIEEIIEDKALDADNTIKKEKLGNKKNKTNSNNFNKKEFANKKKAMYKNKEKLVSNDITTDNRVIIYKDGMTIGDLARVLGVNASELIKKLFSLGLLCTINSPIDYDNAELLVVDYKKELKRESSADVANFEEFEINDRDQDRQL